MVQKAKDKIKIRTRLDDDLYKQLEYWAGRRNNGSINEYVEEAIIKAIQMENKDYDLPAAEIARLNQMIDVITVLSTNIKSLEDVTVSGFDSLLKLTRGDNYLLESDEGDVD